MQTKHSNLTEGSILKSIFILAIPIIIANILQAGYQLTDAFWVGRLGGEAIAAVSVTGPIIFLTIALGVGFSVSGSTLIAQYFGAKNQKMVNHVASQTLLMIASVSLFLGSIGYIITPHILNWMNVEMGVYEGAKGFMRISFIALIFNFTFFMFQSIMRGIGEAKIPVYIVLGTVFLNFILDPLFIFGWKFIPGLGVEGAALATLFTQSIAAIIGLIILLNGKYHVHLSLSDFKPDSSFIKRSFKIGLPASIEQSTRALSMTALTFLIATFGTLTIAAYGAGGNIVQIAMIPSMGLSMAISALVGQNIGAGNIKRAENIGKAGAIIGFTSLTILGLIVFIFSKNIVIFFVPNDIEVINLASVFLRTISLTWGFMGVQFALVGLFRASGNMILAMMIALISQWVLQIPLAYILSKHTNMHTDGLWLSFAITNIVSGFIVIFFYLKGDWKNKKLISDKEREIVQVTEESMIEEGVK